MQTDAIVTSPDPAYVPTYVPAPPLPPPPQPRPPPAHPARLPILRHLVLRHLNCEGALTPQVKASLQDILDHVGAWKTKPKNVLLAGGAGGSSVKGLEALLTKLNLSDHLTKATAWCAEQARPQS